MVSASHPLTSHVCSARRPNSRTPTYPPTLLPPPFQPQFQYSFSTVSVLLFCGILVGCACAPILPIPRSPPHLHVHSCTRGKCAPPGHKPSEIDVAWPLLAAPIVSSYSPATSSVFPPYPLAPSPSISNFNLGRILPLRYIPINMRSFLYTLFMIYALLPWVAAHMDMLVRTFAISILLRWNLPDLDHILSIAPPYRSKSNPNVAHDNIDYSMTAPLKPDGSDYPCKVNRCGNPCRVTEWSTDVCL